MAWWTIATQKRRFALVHGLLLILSEIDIMYFYLGEVTTSPGSSSMVTVSKRAGHGAAICLESLGHLLYRREGPDIATEALSAPEFHQYFLVVEAPVGLDSLASILIILFIAFACARISPSKALSLSSAAHLAVPWSGATSRLSLTDCRGV
eukprot:s1108_g8.t1